MDITIPVTIEEKKYNIFDTANPQIIATDTTVVLHVDDTIKAQLAGIFGMTPAAPLTAAALAATYPVAEIAQALTLALSK